MSRCHATEKQKKKKKKNLQLFFCHRTSLHGQKFFSLKFNSPCMRHGAFFNCSFCNASNKKSDKNVDICATLCRSEIVESCVVETVVVSGENA